MFPEAHCLFTEKVGVNSASSGSRSKSGAHHGPSLCALVGLAEVRQDSLDNPGVGPGDTLSLSSGVKET